MRRILPYIASLLLALWLPVTLHCALEAAEIIPTTCVDEHGGPGGSASDGCDEVENGEYKLSSDNLTVPAPALAVCFCFLSLYVVPRRVPADRIFPFDRRSELPRELVPTWSFVRRAAPLSRAPSLLG